MSILEITLSPEDRFKIGEIMVREIASIDVGGEELLASEREMVVKAA